MEKGDKVYYDTLCKCKVIRKEYLTPQVLEVKDSQTKQPTRTRRMCTDLLMFVPKPFLRKTLVISKEIKRNNTDKILIIFDVLLSPISCLNYNAFEKERNLSHPVY